MADYSSTAASVKASASASVNVRTCGEAGGLVAGEIVYLDDNDKDTNTNLGKAKKATSAAIGTADVDGMCLHASALNQPVNVVSADPGLIPGATLAAADEIILSNTAGKFAPYGDLASTKYLTRLGYAKTTTVMNFSVEATGIVK